jgi:AhpD family alkylhydroperoxidase
MPLSEVPDDLPIVNNLVRAMYHNPDLYRAFGRLAMQVHVSSHLPERTRELAVLAISGVVGAPYQWTQHVVAARRAGVTAAEIGAIEADPGAAGSVAGLSADEALAVEYALAVESGTVTDTLWQRTASSYDEAALLDLTLLATFYGLASRITLALDVPLDAPES